MTTWDFFKRRLIRLQPMVIIGTLGLTPDQLYIGLGRLMYPFFCGLLLYRLGRWRIKLSCGGMTFCSLAVVLTLVTPHIGGDSHPWLNGLYCAIVILVVYPAIVAAGAGSPLRGTRTTAICKFLGMISYPYPMVYVQMNWVARHPDASSGTHRFVAVAIFVASIAVAYASVKAYDMPVRKWLSDRFLSPLKAKRR